MNTTRTPRSLADVARLTRAHGQDRFNLFMKEFIDALSHLQGVWRSPTGSDDRSSARAFG
ncbi:MAG: hypothetical protein Q7T22_04740 [Serpentinimonas sp.]|nr:hypothetical protein [Serpentinimonas sp.]